MRRKFAISVLLSWALIGALAEVASKVEQKSIEDPVYHRMRTMWVYTPPDYEAEKSPCDLLLAFDGDMYVGSFAIRKLLDRLIASKKIPRTVAVFMDNGSGYERNRDLGNDADFVKFVRGTLVPWVRQNYRVSRDPHRALVTGTSNGGLAAAFVAWSIPDVFGNAFSQSGAFWRGSEGSDWPPYEWLTKQLRSQPKRDVRFYLEVGERETGRTLPFAATFIETNRHFREALKEGGYEVRYEEVPGAEHNESHWKSKLEEGLVWALGK
ncbi:MAG: esterase family protein [Acidobacteriales bacterium]|nr:esterase family protein [Terriglobales bacterium]